jgi:hypothetical protein
MKNIVKASLFLLINAIIFVPALGNHKQASDVDTFLNQRFRVYFERGAAKFLEELLKCGVLEGNNKSRIDFDLDKFNKAEKLFGKFVGNEQVLIVKPSSKTRFVYLTIELRKGRFVYGLNTL